MPQAQRVDAEFAKPVHAKRALGSGDESGLHIMHPGKFRVENLSLVDLAGVFYAYAFGISTGNVKHDSMRKRIGNKLIIYEAGRWMTMQGL